MEYYLLKDERQTGPYTLGQVRSMWAAGLVTTETLYWQEGAPEWLPLRTLRDVLDKTPAAPASKPADPSVGRVRRPVAAERDAGREEVFQQWLDGERRSGGTMRPLGLFLILVGLGLSLYFGLVYDPSVELHEPGTYIQGYGRVGKFEGRVSNLARMQNRQIGIIVGIGVCVVGTIMVVAGSRQSAA